MDKFEGFTPEEIKDLKDGYPVERFDGETQWEYILCPQCGKLVSQHCGIGEGCFWTDLFCDCGYYSEHYI